MKPEKAPESAAMVLLDPSHDQLATLARGALEDQRARRLGSNDNAGAKVWKIREPQLATGILALLDVPAQRNRMTSLRAMHAGEVRLLQEKIAQLNGEIRELRFDRDRMRLAYIASHELAEKIAVECADPERIEPAISDRLNELRPTT